MMDDNKLIPGPNDPQLPESSEAPPAEPPGPPARLTDAASEADGVSIAPHVEEPAAPPAPPAEPPAPPPPFCGYPVLKDGHWVPCGKEATDGCAYCDEHGSYAEFVGDDYYIDLKGKAAPPSSYADLQANVEGAAGGRRHPPPSLR